MDIQNPYARPYNGLYSMKDDASNEADRGAIQECINKLRA